MDFKARGRVNGLSIDQEQNLVCLALKGDAESRDSLLLSYRRIIHREARRYAIYAERSDLEQEGMIGVCEAFENYDPSFGVPFRHYVFYWIRKAMMEATAMNRSIRLPNDQVELRIKLHSIEITHYNAHGKQPTTEDYGSLLASKAGPRFSPQSIARSIANYSQYMLSLDRKLDEDSKLTIGAYFAVPDGDPSNYAVLSEIKERVSRALKFLSRWEKTVIQKYFGLDDEKGLTLEAIAKLAGTQKQNAHNAKRNALKKLRMYGRLEDYVLE